MLSKIALLILGFIAEQPLNPYEIKKLCGQLRVERWFPFASSSIYATIKALVKKQYILGTKVKDGNMPEKTIYTITPRGEAALQKTLTTYLSGVEISFSEFDMALVFICHLPQDEALDALQRHQDLIRRDLAIRGQQYTRYEEEETLPYIGLVTMRHTIYKREAELKVLEELIAQIQKNQSWNHFPVQDFLSEDGD